MNKEYIQKDLGYKRDGTKAKLIIRMSNGEAWSVPAQIVVDSRDEYYKEDKEDTVKFIREKSLSKYDISDWAGNNMNWEDVKDYAKKVDSSHSLDYDEEWIDSEKEISEKI